MQIQPDNLYHVYNQGNRKQPIFFEPKQYQLFLVLTKKYIVPNGNILAYCLMPNHFHFLIHTNENSAVKYKLGNIEISMLSNSFRMLLSKYAQVLNREKIESGSVFRQKTKAKLIDPSSLYNAENCFRYIHTNPVKAGLVKQERDWNFSSFNEYLGLYKTGLVNMEIAKLKLDIVPRFFFRSDQNGLTGFS